MPSRQTSLADHFCPHHWHGIPWNTNSILKGSGCFVQNVVHIHRISFLQDSFVSCRPWFFHGGSEHCQSRAEKGELGHKGRVIMLPPSAPRNIMVNCFFSDLPAAVLLFFSKQTIASCCDSAAVSDRLFWPGFWFICQGYKISKGWKHACGSSSVCMSPCRQDDTTVANINCC